MVDPQTSMGWVPKHLNASHCYVFGELYGYESKPWCPRQPKIASMDVYYLLLPNMVVIGFDPSPYQ